MSKPALRIETAYKIRGRSYKSLDRALKSAAETISHDLINFDYDRGNENWSSLGSVRMLENHYSQKKEDAWLDRVEAKAFRRLKRLYAQLA